MYLNKFGAWPDFSPVFSFVLNNARHGLTRPDDRDQPIWRGRPSALSHQLACRESGVAEVQGGRRAADGSRGAAAMVQRLPVFRAAGVVLSSKRPKTVTNFFLCRMWVLKDDIGCYLIEACLGVMKKR